MCMCVDTATSLHARGPLLLRVCPRYAAGNLSTTQLIMAGVGSTVAIGVVILVLRCAGAMGARRNPNKQQFGLVAKRKGLCCFGRSKHHGAKGRRGRGGAGGITSPQGPSRGFRGNRVSVAPMPMSTLLASRSQRSGFLNKSSSFRASLAVMPQSPTWGQHAG